MKASALLRRLVTTVLLTAVTVTCAVASSGAAIDTVRPSMPEQPALPLEAEIGDPVANATLLVERLRDGREAVVLQPLRPERGCGPRGCTVEVGDLVIRDPEGQLSTAHGLHIALREHPHLNAAPPEADWRPITAREIWLRERRWGLCLELSHAGIGRSGSAQRYSSIVVVPWPRGGRPGVANRFVGYWAQCAALVSGARPDAVVLPLVEAHPPSGLRWVEWRCDRRDCKPAAGKRRRLVVDPQGIGGALRLLP